MNREELKEELKSYLKDYADTNLKKSAGGNYNCPACGSGTGKHKSGALSIKGNTWKCFSCGAGGDIFDLIGEVEGLHDYNDRFKRAMEIYNMNYDASAEERSRREIKKKEMDRDKEKLQDFTEFFNKAYSDIDKTEYWKQRGLSRKTVDRFKVGYVESWLHPAYTYGARTSRLIIPISKYSYTARVTSEEVPEGVSKKMKVKGCEKPIWIFNYKALSNAKSPIFVVEGELDAMSIYEVGGEAVAIGSTAFVNSFLDLCKDSKPLQPLIIALDNDSAGRKAAEQIESGLKDLGIASYRFNLCRGYKDANEALQKDRKALEAAVKGIISAEDIEQFVREYEADMFKAEYQKTSAANHLQEFINGIAESVNTPYIPTGFGRLDSALDGGLYEGLYFFGAIPSLGKTTLVLQIADQIAEAGQDVIIFSLEMARTELMAKSISRLTLINTIEAGGRVSDAKTTRGITTGNRYTHYSNTEKELITKSIQQYGAYAGHIYIHEGIGNIGAQQIRETVANHISFTGEKPVVIIDYIQLLAPVEIRASDKQNTDIAVLELKRISRDYKIPLIGISSFNRQNYKEAVTMEAFKESGAIEYTSDVLIGLQLEGAGGKDFNATEEKQKNPRQIELVLLKNRNGATGAKIAFNYYPMFNYFEEK